MPTSAMDETIIGGKPLGLRRISDVAGDKQKSLELRTSERWDVVQMDVGTLQWSQRLGRINTGQWKGIGCIQCHQYLVTITECECSGSCR